MAFYLRMIKQTFGSHFQGLKRNRMKVVSDVPDDDLVVRYTVSVVDTKITNRSVTEVCSNVNSFGDVVKAIQTGLFVVKKYQYYKWGLFCDHLPPHLLER